MDVNPSYKSEAAQADDGGRVDAADDAGVLDNAGCGEVEAKADGGGDASRVTTEFFEEKTLHSQGLAAVGAAAAARGGGGGGAGRPSSVGLAGGRGLATAAVAGQAAVDFAEDTFSLEFDGASRGNPGKGRCAGLNTSA